MAFEHVSPTSYGDDVLLPNGTYELNVSLTTSRTDDASELVYFNNHAVTYFWATGLSTNLFTLEARLWIYKRNCFTVVYSEAVKANSCTRYCTCAIKSWWEFQIFCWMLSSLWLISLQLWHIDVNSRLVIISWWNHWSIGLIQMRNCSLSSATDEILLNWRCWKLALIRTN